MRRTACLLSLLALGCGHRDDRVTAQGTIEVEETDIVSTVRGRVSRIWAEEGATVRAGDTLVTLDSKTLPDDIHEREARVARAAAGLRELERGARPEEIARAQAELRSAAAEDLRAQRDLHRMEALGASDAVSQQEVDQARAKAGEARGRKDAAEQNLRLLQAGATKEALDAARFRLAEAKAHLAQGRATAGELTLVAPVGGVVLPHYFRVGEVVEEGEPILTTADVSRPWVRVYVNQRDVPSLRLGGTAEALLDGDAGRPIPGRIVAINHEAEYIPRVALTEAERADLMFGIKIALSASGSARAGLPATVKLMAAHAQPTQVAEAAR
ncbi:MAG TPA: efflux RND transporter periplasmic adaptor subunit [Gemmatimonadales bacterium]|nr:efflux RND transporter periplasmic adaptor subunit [Gemmatimonadales bacterium]